MYARNPDDIMYAFINVDDPVQVGTKLKESTVRRKSNNTKCKITISESL